MEHDDILYTILQHLEINEIIKCSTVNKQIKKFCDMQYKRFFHADFGSNFEKFFYHISYQQCYVDCYCLKVFIQCKKNYNLVDCFNSQRLSLNNSQIKKIPTSIGQLVNLQHLSLSNNQFDILLIYKINWIK